VPADPHGGVADGLADRGIEVVGRGDLDDLLMPPLDRAVAFVEVDKVAVAVAEELDLDVLGLADVLLDEDVRDAEGGLGLAAGLIDRGVERLGRLDDPHPAPAAPHRCLDDDRIAERLGQDVRPGTGHDRLVAPRQDGDPGGAGHLPRGHLVAEHVEQLGARPDEPDAPRLAGAGEVGVLGQEPIPRVDRLDPFLPRQPDDRLDVQVAANRLARLADLVSLVGLEPVHREPIFVRVDGHGADAQLVGRTEDPDSDFTAVGHQQLTDLGHRTIPVFAEGVRRTRNLTPSPTSQPIIPDRRPWQRCSRTCETQASSSTKAIRLPRAAA
jgi:hypothetical protein